MRKILFRGKKIASDEWVEGSLLDYGDGDFDICVPCTEDGENGLYKYCVRPETVGQFTGMTDKNGKKIFDGDVLRFFYDEGDHCYIEVFWNEKQSQWATREVDRGYVDMLDDFDGERSEVAGNVHDNPELLEVGS